MAKKTEYGIINANSNTELVDAVVGYLSKGWQPLGGAVSAVNADGEPVLMQTLVRSGTPNKPARRRIV